MSASWTGSSRLRSSTTNHARNPINQLGTLDDDAVSLMSGEDEDDEDGEDEDDDAVFKRSLKMPPYVHAKRQLAQLIGMLHD